MTEWTDGSQPVRQTVGCGKWVAVSLLTYRDCRYFLCGGSEVIGGLFFLYSSIPMGRKSRFFGWTELRAEQVGIIQSLISTCKLHDVNPFTYLTDVVATDPDPSEQGY